MSQILCVDDNDNNLYMLNTLLCRAGFEVIEARTGEEAVALALAHRPDLVLMDLTLPGIDGCEATRQIRAAPEIGSVPIIALSAHAEEDMGTAAREAGCTGYSRKPIQIRDLLISINDLLSGGASASCVPAARGSAA
ncbi:MAG: response regulator [Alphaproteobacteria bacterium]